MNEIEKLYELAELNNLWLEEYYASDNVHPVQIWHKSYNEMIKSMMETNTWARSEAVEVAKKECRKALPPFTAEKQLELIKWLGIRDEFNFYQNKVTKDWIFYDHEKDATHYNFELGLASWVNYLWQDLTEEEKQQVKGILE